MRRFFAPPDAISDSKVILSSDETHHLRDVLRLREGAEVAVFDGEGRQYSCRVASIEKASSILTLIQKTEAAAPESPLRLTVAAAVLPGHKYDLVVQKMVELGSARLVPLITLRSETTGKDAARRLTRWQRIAMEATKQCGRAKLMEIAQPLEFSSLLSNTETSEVILFSERDGSPFGSFTAQESMTVMFGPKGGWDDKELGEAAELGVSIVTMGGRILKAETAAIALTAVLQHRFGDIN